MKTARNVVLNRLSARAERYIMYFNFAFFFVFVKIKEVHIRMIIISGLEDEI